MQKAINLYASFFKKEFKLSIFIIIISILSSLFKVNVIALITAKIISSIKSNNIDLSYNLFYYFIVISFIYLFITFLYKLADIYFKIKLKEYIRKSLIEELLTLHNENLKDINFVKFGSPVFIFSNSSFYIFNSIYNTLLPNITILFVVLCYFLYYSNVLALIFLIGNFLIIFYVYYKSKFFLENGVKYQKKTNSTETNILDTLNKIMFKDIIDDEINSINKNCDYIFKYSYNYYKDLLYENTIINIFLFIIFFICLYKLIILYYSKNISSTIFITFITILLIYKEYFMVTLNDMYSIIETISKILNISDIFDFKYEENKTIPK